MKKREFAYHNSWKKYKTFILNIDGINRSLRVLDKLRINKQDRWKVKEILFKLSENPKEQLNWGNWRDNPTYIKLSKIVKDNLEKL